MVGGGSQKSRGDALGAGYLGHHSENTSPGNLDSSLCYIMTSFSHDVSAYKLNKQGDNIQP